MSLKKLDTYLLNYTNRNRVQFSKKRAFYINVQYPANRYLTLNFCVNNNKKPSERERGNPSIAVWIIKIHMKLNGNYVCSIRRYMFGQFKPILCGKHIMICKQLLENWYVWVLCINIQYRTIFLTVTYRLFLIKHLTEDDFDLFEYGRGIH